MVTVLSEPSHDDPSEATTMRVTYEEETSLREARRLYFDTNGFGETGGYDDAWVDFKLGPVPMPFPNTKSRVEAVRYHDLHHILTGYATDIVGELEISAWEIAAGCKGFAAAWVLNLGGMAGGLFRAPRRVFAAFVRGRRQRTVYGERLDAILDLSVREARSRFTPDPSSTRVVPSDVVLFVLATALGIAVAALLLVVVVPIVPIGLLAHAHRRRGQARAAT
jgi:hypothetical protein